MWRNIKKAAIEGTLIQKILHYIFIRIPVTIIQKTDALLGRVIRYPYVISSKVEKNKIVFMTYNDDYSCNPKYIAEEILRQALPWDLVWVVPKESSKLAHHVPPKIRCVSRDSYEACKEIATAKVWVDNSINFLWNCAIPKKNDQFYIETWHGSMGIKRVGKGDVKNKKWVRVAKKCKKVTTFCISNSTFENDVYRTTHWPTTPILLYGHPRNDYLFQPEKMAKIRRHILQQYDLSETDHILLYAPTFRDNGYQDCYSIDFERLTEALTSRFGGDWKILLRMHFHDRKKRLCESYFPDNVVNVTDYPDMQELLMAADAGITDYSSWAYDFVLTRRPLFIYATDLDAYNNERGLYFPLESTPFPVAADNECLMKNILHFNDKHYRKEIDLFLDGKGCAEDGHASERVVEKLKEIMGA